MTSLRKIAAPITFVTVICGAAILWPVYNEKATERKLAVAARIRAEQGDANAQYTLGFMYYQGQGVPRDDTEVVRWYRKAAGQGYAKAQYGLCYMYGRGQEVQQDYAEAARWCRKAADQGDATAQYVLGLRYVDGEGVPQDYAEAAGWYRRAADQGDAKAQYVIGWMYYRGQGVPQDYAEAFRWFRKAADQGDPAAQSTLTVSYFKGRGAPRNYTEALRWFGKVLASCFAKDRTRAAGTRDIRGRDPGPANTGGASTPLGTSHLAAPGTALRSLGVSDSSRTVRLGTVSSRTTRDVI